MLSKHIGAVKVF